MLRAENINKSFGSLRVLTDVGLEIKKGEFVSIVGPSGAGKTTLLQILSTLQEADSGKVYIDGTDVFGLKQKEVAKFRNQSLGFVFQFHQLLPEFTAEENVMMPALIGRESKETARKRAAELLARLGLSDRAHHKPSELSGGEKQRIAVARALINNPKIIFADEPTGSLDTQNRDELQSLLLRLRDEMGMTIVVVTHDMELAKRCDRIIEMKDGRIAAQGE